MSVRRGVLAQEPAARLSALLASLRAAGLSDVLVLGRGWVLSQQAPASVRAADVARERVLSPDVPSVIDCLSAIEQVDAVLDLLQDTWRITEPTASYIRMAVCDAAVAHLSAESLSDREFELLTAGWDLAFTSD